MGIKEIFQEGMKEFKRKSALHKEKKELRQKQDVHEEQLTTLGQKAWEEKLNIDNYGNLKELLTNSQQEQDALDGQIKDLEQKKQETEEKKKQENENFEARIKTVEERKKGVDERLAEEKKTLKDAQKEVENLDRRLAQIAAEQDALNKKAADPQIPEEEKAGIPGKLEKLTTEKNDLDGQKTAKTASVKELVEKVTPIQEESDNLKKEIDDIRAEQKKAIGDLDEALSDIKKETDGCNTKLKEARKDQQGNFKLLGEKLSDDNVDNPAAAEEMQTVKATEKEIEDIKVEIQTLEQAGSSASSSAFWKMIGIAAGGIIAIVVIIILLAMLFKPGDKTADKPTAEAPGSTASQTVQEESETTGETAKQTPPATMEDAVKHMQDATGELKKRSEEIHGKIVVADKETLTAALPTIDGWTMETPSYRKHSFGQMEGSMLSVTYTGPGSQQLEVDINDTATQSALLQPVKLLFSLNRSIEHENGYEKISTYKGMKVIEKYDKQSKEASFNFIVNDRYLVKIECQGENSLELLKEFTDRFDFSKLK
jgi:tetrahydromethanopterin S-methyltransferase subunit F